MAESIQWMVKVLRVPEGASLRPGTTWPLSGPAVVLGRSPTADLVVADRTVSREHLRIEVGPRLRIVALTEANGTFVDQQPIARGVPVELPAEGARVQLGGVLIGVVPLTETEPVWDLLTSAAPRAEPTGVALDVTWDAGQCVVRCGGLDIGLRGAAARMLGLLAARAGEVVHHWDLQEDLSTPHLAPLATAIRQALAQAVERGVLSESLLRQRLAAATGAAEPDGLEALMRRVVQSRRGHGYVLHLLPSDIRSSQV